MPGLNTVTVGDAYGSTTPPAAILNVFNSRGGWFSIANNGVFFQIQYGIQGENYLMDEQELGAGGFVTLPRDAIGVQFRNSVAGSAAVVSAFISQGPEPAISIDEIGAVASGASPSNLFEGRATVTAGTASRISTSSISCVGVVVRATPTNSGNVYLGNSSVSSASGYILSPGDAVGFDFNNVTNIFIDGDHTGDQISWMAVD